MLIKISFMSGVAEVKRAMSRSDRFGYIVSEDNVAELNCKDNSGVMITSRFQIPSDISLEQARQLGVNKAKELYQQAFGLTVKVDAEFGPYFRNSELQVQHGNAYCEHRFIEAIDGAACIDCAGFVIAPYA